MPVIGLACAGAALLSCQTSPASAATRGFRVKNDSNHELRVVGVSPVPRVLCVGTSGIHYDCVQTDYLSNMESRPKDGSILSPGGTQTWELEYLFNPRDFFGVDYNFAAKLKYRIGAGGTFEATIKTSNYVNDSNCEVIPKSLGSCTAAGRNISFK